MTIRALVLAPDGETLDEVAVVFVGMAGVIAASLVIAVMITVYAVCWQGEKWDLTAFASGISTLITGPLAALASLAVATGVKNRMEK